MDECGVWYDDVRVGDTFSRTLTITDAHLVAGAGLIGDFNPHHTSDTFAKHAARFLAPVRPNDTITTTWTVTSRADKPKHGGGVVALHGVCRNQGGATVAEADAKMLVSARV